MYYIILLTLLLLYTRYSIYIAFIINYTVWYLLLYCRSLYPRHLTWLLVSGRKFEQSLFTVFNSKYCCTGKGFVRVCVCLKPANKRTTTGRQSIEYQLYKTTLYRMQEYRYWISANWRRLRKPAGLFTPAGLHVFLYTIQVYSGVHLG